MLGELLRGGDQDGEFDKIFQAVDIAQVCLSDGERIQSGNSRGFAAVLDRKAVAESSADRELSIHDG